MGGQTSTFRHGLLLMFVSFFALTSIAYAQNAANRHKVSYVKHIDDNGNEVMYEIIDQPTEVTKTRSAIQVQENDKLQKQIDSLADGPATRAANTVTDIDLSAYSEPRATTLYIRNGVNVRFVNGTLTRAKSLTDAPLVQIIDDSRLHLATTAAISGNNFFTQGAELVEVLDGRLDVEGGKISGNKDSKTTGVSVYAFNDKSVVMVNAGEVENLNTISKLVYAYGGNIGLLALDKSVYLKDDITSRCYLRQKDSFLYVEDEGLSSSADITISNYSLDQYVVKNVNNQSTANRFKLGYSDNITGNKDDYQLSYENNSLIVRRKASADPNLIYNEDQLGTRLKEIADNKESSASNPVKLTVAPNGFTISSSVLVYNCYVEISGGPLTIVKNTDHSPFMVLENSGLKLDNISIDFGKFDSNARGFDNSGGTLTIGKDAVFLNAASSKWYDIPFYYLYSGNTIITPTWQNIANEVFSIYFSKFQDNVVLLTSALDYARISARWDSYDSDEPYTLIMGSGYTLKESDFKNMQFEGLPENLVVYYDGSDYSVKLKKVDPNYITNEDDLQKRLDEIAAEKPSEAVTLTICEEGITLTKTIFVQSGCKAIITGGKISTPSSMPYADLVFSISNGVDLTFREISLELCTLRASYCYHFFSYENLTFNHAKVIADKLTINGECRIDGYTQLPMLYLSGQSRIYLLSAMQETWIIDGDWSSFSVEEPYLLISGYDYAITEADYSRMQFANLPSNIEAIYDNENQTVVLKKKTPTLDDLLQCLVDGRPDCKADDNGEVEVPEDGTDIGCEDELQCAVDATLDGEEVYPNPWEVIPWLRFCGCVRPIIRIYRGSSLTIRNFNIEANRGEGQIFYVYGTLVIDVNVYIYHFLRFIHIMPGGRVIWRGGHAEDVDEIVYNGGGTLEIEGDFDNGGKCFENPEGGTLIIRDGTFNGDIENHGTLIIEGGTVHGGIDNYGTITIVGGFIDGGRKPGLTNHDGGSATIEGGTVKCDGGDIHDIYNNDGGKLIINDGSKIGDDGKGCIWSETDIWIEGGVRVTDIYIRRGCRIHVIGKLTVIWRIHFFIFDDFDVYIPFIFGDEGYRFTEEDFANLRIDLPKEYRWVFIDGVVVIVRIPYNVTTIVEYLDYFGPHGNFGQPWSPIYDTTNIDINTDWHIQKDYHLKFDGGTFTMGNGDIYIDDGASLWLKNIKFKGTDHHIYVYGTLYIDEKVDFVEIVNFIHICKGGEIRFVTKPEYIVNIIVEEEHIVTDVAIIYDIIAEWLQYLHIDIPDGYEWKYDDTTHTIILSFASGIDEMLMNTNGGEPVYDLSGKQQPEVRKGLNIIREKNGRAKKVIVKNPNR